MIAVSMFGAGASYVAVSLPLAEKPLILGEFSTVRFYETVGNKSTGAGRFAGCGWLK
jgi:hypothetical protein